jgi:S-adenosylmethionine hydrolase
MSRSPIITLTTDFGEGSPYVAEMKGVILSINPDARLVDVTHAISPQDIRQGALALASATVAFPPGSIHVAVVDPGVGTSRLLVYAEIAGQRYLAPDNGLLSRLATSLAPSKMLTIANERWFRQPVSATFHGRDILSPAAAQLSLGLEPEELGPPHPRLVMLDWPGAQMASNRITGQVTEIDSFGNLITNITRDQLAGVPTDDRAGVFCDDEHETRGIFTAYADQPEMTLIALVGSHGHLELAIVGDSAKIMLGVGVGAPVEVRW